MPDVEAEVKKDATVAPVDEARGVEAEGKEDAGYIFPALGNGPTSFYVPESKAFWVGIPADRTDVVLAMLAFDRAKFDYAQQFFKLQAMPKIQKPTGWQNIKNKFFTRK